MHSTIISQTSARHQVSKIKHVHHTCQHRKGFNDFFFSPKLDSDENQIANGHPFSQNIMACLLCQNLKMAPQSGSEPLPHLGGGWFPRFRACVVGGLAEKNFIIFCLMVCGQLSDASTGDGINTGSTEEETTSYEFHPQFAIERTESLRIKEMSTSNTSTFQSPQITNLPKIYQPLSNAPPLARLAAPVKEIKQGGNLGISLKFPGLNSNLGIKNIQSMSMIECSCS